MIPNMNMLDVTPFPEWVFRVNIPNMVQLAQKWRRARRFLLTMKNPMKNNIKEIQSRLQLKHVESKRHQNTSNYKKFLSNFCDFKQLLSKFWDFFKQLFNIF